MDRGTEGTSEKRRKRRKRGHVGLSTLHIAALQAYLSTSLAVRPLGSKSYMAAAFRPHTQNTFNGRIPTSTCWQFSSEEHWSGLPAEGHPAALRVAVWDQIPSGVNAISCCPAVLHATR